jgi:hypothetical protein
MLYSSALVSILWLIYQALLGVAYCIRCWTLAVGTVMFVAELVRKRIFMGVAGAGRGALSCPASVCAASERSGKGALAQW